MYKEVIRPILFRQDPERVHTRAIRMGSLLGRCALSRAVIDRLFTYRNPVLHTTVAGISFENPIGLAAGFDKNAQLARILPSIGFGFAELGSVTGEPCAGNPKPRLFRIPAEKSILVNCGLYNHGADVISRRLKNQQFKIPIGLSIAKTNNPALTTTQGIQDYAKAFRLLHPLGSYTTINVSCPNTSDGTTFSDPNNFHALLKRIAKERIQKPIFCKIKPDTTPQIIRELIDIAEQYEWVNGFVISNLTSNRHGLATSKAAIDQLSPKGGLSGKPTREKSIQLIKTVHKLTDKTIIGCGGVFNGQDAYDKLAAGASLIQLVTALIYEGPGVVGKINKELVDIMNNKGYSTVRDITPPA